MEEKKVLSSKEQNRINLKNELVELEEQIKTETDPEKLKQMEHRINFINKFFEPRPSQESLLLPEYREGGYFTSPEFKKIEAEVDETLFETGIDIKDFEEAKKILLRELYNIDWKPSYDRFIQGTIVIVD